MKILFITHSGNFIYGAERSLGLLLSNISIQYDIMFDKRILNTIPMKEIQKHAGANCENIMFANYPLDFRCLDTESLLSDFRQSIYRTLRGLVGKRLNALKAYMNKKYLDKIINDKQYDLVVLNSLVLYNLLGSTNPTILYVRESASRHLKHKIMNKLNSASGIICIDKTTEKYLLIHKDFDNNIPRIILTNPVDMNNIKNINKLEIQARYNIKEDYIVFTIAGVITKAKGIDFVLEAFNQVGRKNAVLLVVGNDNGDFGKELKQKYSTNVNIKFIGEIINMEEIYSISDYLLRGDDRYAIGRTVLEALYSGCDVIMQGDYNNNIADFKNFPRYKKRINFYKPRDTKDLMKYFSILNKVHKCIDKFSNIDEYMMKFMTFAQSVASK